MAFTVIKHLMVPSGGELVVDDVERITFRTENFHIEIVDGDDGPIIDVYDRHGTEVLGSHGYADSDYAHLYDDEAAR